MKILPPWFRIHLSTALILMIAASVMLGMNLAWHPDGSSNQMNYCRGWPLTCFALIYGRDHWTYENLAINILTAIVLLIVIAVVLEKRIAILRRLKE